MTSSPNFHNLVGSGRGYQTASLGARKLHKHGVSLQVQVQGLTRVHNTTYYYYTIYFYYTKHKHKGQMHSVDKPTHRRDYNT